MEAGPKACGLTRGSGASATPEDPLASRFGNRRDGRDRARGGSDLVRSCLYVGEVRHERLEPFPNRFRYRLFMAYADLAELDRVFRGRWLWGVERRTLVSFRRADHMGDPSLPLDSVVRERVEAECGFRPSGPIALLTQLRMLGFVFNPVSFYFCFDAAGERVEALVAEVTNTPWKQFELEISALAGGRAVFRAQLSLARREITGCALARTLARQPLAPARLFAAIYWQALRLALRGAPFHSHPRRSAGATEVGPT
jgi:uncharacterized protein